MFVNFLVVVGSAFVVSAILVVILAVRAPHIPRCDEVKDSEETAKPADKPKSRSA